jgi:hypothetical protein
MCVCVGGGMYVRVYMCVCLCVCVWRRVRVRVLARVRVRMRIHVQWALTKASVNHVQSRSASPSFYSPVLARLWLYSPHALSC